jgi:hypothetical protein
VANLFGSRVAEAHTTEKTATFRYPSGEDYVATFRRWYGPTVKAFDALAACEQHELAGDLAALAEEHDVHRGGRDVAVASRYLETVLTL